MPSTEDHTEDGSCATPRFLDAGEAALVVEFGSIPDPAISARVLALDAALSEGTSDGIRELVPTYRSLMIHYDPLRLTRDTLVERVDACLVASSRPAATPSHWAVPCCYEPPYGEDIEEIAGQLDRTVDQIIANHTAATYRAYMYGFAPGYTYLGGLPTQMAVPRRRSPRDPHAAGAVLIGGGLCSISTFSMPSGWYVIGRTPERLYAAERQAPFLMEPGDTITFEPIDAVSFEHLDRRAATGEVVARRTRR